mmetsp:Transcript_12552/g.20694  ORF Transcript_12552/g.20694 Transcript_12552/m.20694 type:complete len:310 (+) Transcript_12552:2133-3062(+)
MASDQTAQVASLQKELDKTRDLVKVLAERIKHGEANDTIYAASCYAGDAHNFNAIPQNGMPAKHVANLIEDIHLCDFNPLLNTSSYVNVTSEPEEKAVAAIGAQINIADASVYPASIELHDRVVNMYHFPDVKRTPFVPTELNPPLGSPVISSVWGLMLDLPETNRTGQREPDHPKGFFESSEGSLSSEDGSIAVDGSTFSSLTLSSSCISSPSSSSSSSSFPSSSSSSSSCSSSSAASSSALRRSPFVKIHVKASSTLFLVADNASTHQRRGKPISTSCLIKLLASIRDDPKPLLRLEDSTDEDPRRS